MLELQLRSLSWIQALKRYLWPLLQRIHRIEVVGMENIPSSPALWISNHNSGALIESHSLLFLLQERGRTVYGLNHPALFRLPLIGIYFRKIGAISATKEASRECLENGHDLIIFPGGNRQVFRPWKDQHNHSFPWAKGWADIARENQVPVVPVKFIGSHNCNPIFHRSQALSKFLILPWLLGVKWFPISLAQILVAMGLAAAGFSLGLNSLGIAIAAYLGFCFSPLLPVLPAKIKIRIYPAIQPPAKNGQTQALLDNVASLMDARDYPQGKRRRYALNGVERFMLQHETEQLAYNSHLIFEFENSIDRERILTVTQKWIESMAQVRSSVETGAYRSQRHCYEHAWFSAKDIVEFRGAISQDAIDSFCQKAFHLAFEPAVRFLVMEEAQRTCVVFSCHHSLFDGAGQMYAMEDWSRIYNDGSPKHGELRTFRFRSLTSRFGLLSSLKLFWANLSVSPPRIKTSVATLAANSSHPGRKVKSRVLRLPSSLREDFYLKSLQVLDKTLAEAGDPQSPIVVYVPVGLRFLLKVKSLQNLVVSHVLFFKRQALGEESFPEKFNGRLKSDPLKANIKFLFGVLPLCSIFPEKKLKKDFARLDSPSAHVTSTALLVHAPIPRAFPTPKDWHHLYISARGTLLRSPAVGFVSTGKPGYETLTIEYVEGLVPESTVDQLVSNWTYCLAPENTMPGLVTTVPQGKLNATEKSPIRYQ